jgi:hypothetical protein
MENHLKYYIALDAVTDTTVSNKFYVGGAKRIAVLLRRAANAGGTSTFSIKGSLDEIGTVTPTMTALNMWLDNVTNANTQTLTRVNGTAIAASNGDKFLWLDPACIVTYLEITVTETADGQHSAWIICEY